MMSYPNCGGRDKPERFPDVGKVAKLFEELDIDMRVVLLDRSPESVLVSTLMNRHFGDRLILQSALYRYAYEVVMAQLETIDPNFVISAMSIEQSLEANEKSLVSLKDFLGFDGDTMWQSFRAVFEQKNVIECIRSENETNFEHSLQNLYEQAHIYRKIFLTKFGTIN